MRGQSDGAPAIFADGVVNAASWIAPPAAGSGLAQGSLVSIFGANLGPETGVSAAAYPLALELAGVSIDIRTSTGATLAAIPLFVSAGQINALLPSETPVGLNLISVRRDGMASAFVAIKVVRGSVGLFASGSGPVRPAAAQRYFGDSNQPLATIEAPARRGETVILWGTGLGPVAEPETNPPETRALDTPIEVVVGNVDTTISYQGRAPCCVGLDQINIRIPDDAPTGCLVPVWVSVSGSQYSNVATIPISEGGEPCAENPPLAATPPGGPTGRILLRRIVELADSLNPIEATTSDVAEAVFARSIEEPAHGDAPGASRPTTSQDAPAAFAAGGLPAIPPNGTCLMYDAGPAETIAPLDAGEQIELDGPAGRFALPRINDEYSLSAPPGLLFLGPGAYQVASLGGAGFPPFTAEVSSGEPASLTAMQGTETQGGGIPSAGLEPRLDGLSLEWDVLAAAPDATLVVGRNSAAIPNAGDDPTPRARFVCAASTNAGSFVIPAAILANLPDTTADVELASAWGPRRLEFSTDGPESGTLAYLHAQRASVRIGQAHLPGTPVELPDGSSVHAELAATFGERQRGLMFRRELPAGEGMLFLFDTPGSYGFWMLNTLVPLDIIWLDSEQRVVFVSENTPPCPQGTFCPTYGSQAVAQFVLELAAGQAAAHGLEPGDRLDW